MFTKVVLTLSNQVTIGVVVYLLLLSQFFEGVVVALVGCLHILCCQIHK